MLMIRKLCLIAPFLTSACIAEVTTAPSTEGTSGGVAIMPGPGCDQTRLDPAQIIGKRPEDLGIERFPFPVRVIPPGIAVPLDHNPARLYLEPDAMGVSVRLRCGRGRSTTGRSGAGLRTRLRRRGMGGGC